MRDNYSATFAAKWPEGVANRGFAPIPKCLITCMAELGLKPQEAVALFNIIERCWKAGDRAWPRVDYIAANIGRKNSATREILTSLAKKGFLGKEQRYNSSNLYDLEPAAQKLAKHMKNCKHTAGSPGKDNRKSGGRGSQKSSDYIEPVLNRTNNVDSIYSHIVKNNNDDDLDIEIVSRKNILHPCETDSGEFKHDWDEPFDVYKGLNKMGEQVIWRYKQCKRCQDKYHTKANPSNYRWEAGELINISDYSKMETV